MPNYLLITRPARRGNNQNDPQAWMSWFESIAKYVVEDGSPFRPGAVEVSGPDRPRTIREPFNGFTIIRASNYGQAVDIARRSPAGDQDSSSTMEVYELSRS